MTKGFSTKNRKDLKYLDKGNPYYEYKKYEEPTVCKECGLVYTEGRWAMRLLKEKEAKQEICPACRIIKDRVPFGVVILEGNYLNDNTKKEIKNLVKNVEEKTKITRPLQRIMGIEEEDKKITIYTTYDHLAQRIGKAIYNAFKGELTIKYTEGERYSRVYWKRD